MFLKPFRVKSKSQIKGSDKKKLKNQIKKQFNLPDSDDSIVESLLPSKEDATITKIYTHNGDVVLVYSVGNNPLFFEVDKQKLLYPTVYVLWKFPNLLGRNFMSTVAGVVPKISNGADLMLPGVVADVANHGMNAYCDGKLKKGEALFVNLINNKAAIAVGTAFQSSEDLYMQGMRGKAVNVLHFVGDQLWMMGSKAEIPNQGPIEIVASNSTTPKEINDKLIEASSSYNGEKVTAHHITNMNPGPSGTLTTSIESAVANIVLSSSCDTPTNKDILRDDSILDTLTCQTVLSEQFNRREIEIGAASNDQNLITKSAEERMDTLIENAFLHSLKTTAKKLELPILISSFYRCHMIPACPSEIGGPIDLKKSSFKKLSKFLDKMVDEKVITLKEEKHGVEVITTIDYEHEKISRYRPLNYGNQDSSQNQNKNISTNQFVAPVITELYLVSAQVTDFFRNYDKKKGDGLTSSEVRDCVRDYVNKEKLQHPTDFTMINLDPVLAEIVLVKGENDVTFRWDKLTSRITNKMSRGYKMEIKIGHNIKTVFQKGKLEPIEMMLGSRSGNKKVTLVHNLDLYGIDMAEFAHKCQIGVAASTTIHEAPNKKRAGGQPVMEVLIQGNQVAFASKLLIDEYKLPRKYMRGTELAVKAKGPGKK